MIPSVARTLAAWLAVTSAVAAPPPEPAPAPRLPSVMMLPPELDRVLRDYERAWQAPPAGATPPATPRPQ